MSHEGASHPRIHPAAYMALILPFGATGGFVSVALAFLATKHGLSVEQGAFLVSASMFPNVWKFLWAPIADITLSRKKWYVLACLVCGVGMLAMAAIPLGPSTLMVLMAVIAITSFAATFLGFAVEGLLAHLTRPEDRGRYSGWFQAGNLGGNGIGGGIGLTLLTHYPNQPQIAGIVLGALRSWSCSVTARSPPTWLHCNE